jgi:hypothetical protein
MNKQILLGIIIILVILISSCKKSDPEKDFKVEVRGDIIVITKYLGSKSEVIIPSKIQKLPVIEIDSEAFKGRNLTSVIISNGVKYIGKNAFEDNKLVSVNIPNSITLISEGAFYNNKLTNITIPNNVTSIGSWAFRENPLTFISVPNSVNWVGTKRDKDSNLIENAFPDMPDTMFRDTEENRGGFIVNVIELIPRNYTYRNGNWSEQ